MGSIFAAMRRCQLFDGIPEEKYQNVLNCLHGEVRAIPKDTILLRIGDCQKRPGVVMSGTLRISLYSEDGNLLTIDRLSRGRVFGETLVCSMSQDAPFKLMPLTIQRCSTWTLTLLVLQQRTVSIPEAGNRQFVAGNGKRTLFHHQKMRIWTEPARNRLRSILQGLPVASRDEIRL